MNYEELLVYLDLDTPDEFEYFEAMADLVECEEYIEQEAVEELFRGADGSMIAELLEDYFEDILEEIENSKADVREMTIFAMLQRAAYNKMNKNLSDYDKRMDIILGDLKEDFREQTI